MFLTDDIKIELFSGSEGQGQPPSENLYEIAIDLSISFAGHNALKIRRSVQCVGWEFLFIVPVR